MLQSSEVPWGTVITGVIAIYGAALSTFNFTAQRSRDRRSQADQVSGWLDATDVTHKEGDRYFSAGFVIQNKSALPVFDLIVSLVRILDRGKIDRREHEHSTRFRVFVGVSPGEIQGRVDHPGHGMHARFGIELIFQDAAGRYWLREGNGFLRKIRKRPGDLFGLNEPLPWRDR